MVLPLCVLMLATCRGGGLGGVEVEPVEQCKQEEDDDDEGDVDGVAQAALEGQVHVVEAGIAAGDAACGNGQQASRPCGRGHDGGLEQGSVAGYGGLLVEAGLWAGVQRDVLEGGVEADCLGVEVAHGAVGAQGKRDGLDSGLLHEGHHAWCDVLALDE